MGFPQQVGGGNTRMHWAAINNLGLSACYTALSLWLNIFVLSEQTHNDTWERKSLYLFTFRNVWLKAYSIFRISES